MKVKYRLYYISENEWPIIKGEFKRKKDAELAKRTFEEKNGIFEIKKIPFRIRHPDFLEYTCRAIISIFASVLAAIATVLLCTK